MAVSDNRPFILIFTEEETMLLYTTIPNRTNSKSVAAKHVLTRIAANRVVDTHEEPIASIGYPYSKVDIYYFLMVVEDFAL
jgi:hypothetical protein